MFEDLRNEGNASPLFQEQDEPDPLLDAPVKRKSADFKMPKFKFGRKFLGMTAFQRFVLSLALLIMVSTLSLAILVVGGALVPL